MDTIAKRKDLNYFWIREAGVPVTENGLRRFVFFALTEGDYKEEEVQAYLKNLKEF